MDIIYELEPDTRRKSHVHSPIAFSFANCQGGLCKCKDFVPKDLICPPIAHHVSICKLRKLLEEPLSHRSYDLHSFYLNNFTNVCAQGFYINDMPYLTRVLEILAERIEISGIYRRYLKKFLKIASLIPLVYSNSDKIDGVLHFGKYLSILGLLAIWLTEKKLRILVYEALIELLTNTTKMFVNSVEINFRFVAIENSHLPEIITQLMEIVADDEYCHILKIALALSQISNVTCKKMMVTDAVNFLLMRLLPCEDTNSTNAGYVTNLSTSKEFLVTCNITCHILINLVSSLKKETNQKILNAVTPKGNLLWAIRYLLRGLIFNGTRNVRNMLMEFILLCIDIFPFIEIVSSYLASDLAELSVATEYINCEDWLCNVQFENNPEDICFKKMLLMSLCFVDKYPTLYTIFESKNVLKGLLRLISPDYKTMWHPRDQDTIRSFALISINSIVPYLIRNFFENNGINCLLRAIEPYTIPLNNTNNPEHLLDILRVFKQISEKSNGMIIHSYIMSSTRSIITKLCENILDGDIITYHDQNILTHCFCILCYYNNIPNNMNTDDADDESSEACCCPSKGNNCGCCQIILAVHYLQRILKPHKNDSCINSRTIIAAINYLWTMLLINDNIVQEFIKMEGVYILLDVIDVCPLPVQVIGLGCLVDIISESHYAIPFILTWRGATNKKQIFISLLARIFRDECKKIGTRLNANDIIIDIFYPLMGKVQYQEILLNDKNFIPNTALADLLGSARPKIYALLQILNTRYESNVNIINDHYKIGIAPVSRNDLIILHLANNYFALKISESWHELSQSLIASNIDPIDVDAQMIYNLTEKMQKWNEGVQKNQEIILNLEIKKDINLELRLYEIFRQCRLQYAIDALRELKFFARTTDRMFREAHKSRQRLTIESNKHSSSYTVYYETFIKDLNSTALFNMEFILPSNNIRK